MTDGRAKSRLAYILGIFAIGIALLNLGWLVFYAISFRLIINSLLAFVIGIAVGVGSIILLWRLQEFKSFLKSSKLRSAIIYVIIFSLPLAGAIIFFSRVAIDIPLYILLTKITSLQLIVITDFAFYLLGAVFTFTSSFLLYHGIRHVKKPYPRKRVRKLVLVIFMVLVVVSPILLILPLMYVCPIVIPFPHGNLEPGLMKSTDLFISGIDGYYTYRIPSLLSLPNNTILAFCEGRRLSPLDMGDIDLVIKHSEDGGETWSPLRVLQDAGWLTAGNPCPVYDNDTGMIWLPFTIENDRIFVINSSDGGKTWSPRREITSEVKSPSWGSNWYATGPGHGIQLLRGPNKGRLLIPTYAKITGLTYRRSFMIYSDDHGATWHAGNYTTIGDECMAVETMNGSLYMTIRNTIDYLQADRRLYSWSHDGGLNWEPVKVDNELITPTCEASINLLTQSDNYTRNRTIFINPTHPWERRNLAVHLSYDECDTWNVSRTIYSGPAGYSDVVVLENRTICALFEMGTLNYHEYLVFVKFNLTWLTKGLDTTL